MVFLSHSSLDKELADKICSRLEADGIPCWIAPRDIEPGASYPNEIIRGIKQCDIFVVILSNNSVNSQHVITETDIAFNKGKRIIPYFTEEVELGDSMSYYLARKQWILGYKNTQESLKKLILSIKQTHTSNDDERDKREEEKIEDNSNQLNKNTSFGSFLKNIFKYNGDLGYSKKQIRILLILTALIFIIFPLLGFILAIVLYFYRFKLRYFFNRRNTIILSFIIGGILAIWIAFLIYDSYLTQQRYENYLKQDLILNNKNTEIIEALKNKPDQHQDKLVNESYLPEETLDEKNLNYILLRKAITKIEDKEEPTQCIIYNYDSYIVNVLLRIT